MAKSYNSKKWGDTFPANIGNQTRPTDAVDNTLEYETDGFPQHIANDPVRYDKMNAVVSQSMSNDERLNEKIKRTSDNLAAHNKDPKAHATGIAGNAATASKLASPRTISLTGKASGSASFDGSANASINVTNVNADTASKLSTARKINITGNASGAANFDGSGDIGINTTVNESKHAAAASKVTTNIASGQVAAIAHAIVGGDDGVAVRAGSTAANAGYLELATADDGTEPIYVRQYASGRGGDENAFTNCVRTAALLDGNGNTSFPGTVTAPTFSGSLNGNATTATKATTANNVENNIFYSSDATNVVSGDKLLVVKRAKAGVDNVPNNGLVLQTGANGQYNGQLYITDNGNDGVWVNGWSNGTRGSWTRLVENKGSWNINSSTATKLQTPRTISLTGNASGNATFDGSGNVSINTTVSESKHASDVKDATVSMKASSINGTSVMASGVINQLSDLTGSNDLTSMSKLRSFVGSVSNGNWYNVISSRHRNGTDDGNSYGFLLYTGLTDDSSFRYRKQHDSNYWTGERTLLDSSNYNAYAPTKTGSGASGTWGINITGNADTVDGYHASDLFRHLGGNQTPVITDIFDRAGTIDMSTMSAADKTTHKNNINKAANMTQNIWNTDTGVRAYGGDFDMSGYNHGTLKLTQSYKNFDKIIIYGTEDKGGYTYYNIWDVWELAQAFANNTCFILARDGGNYWMVTGTTKHGNSTRVWSTDTVWSCQEQNSGIVAIYGIKY